MSFDFSIRPPKTSKDKIKQPALVEHGIIPKLGSSMILCGKSGSGKSVLVHNLITDPRFYGGKKSFDLMFLISPTGLADDVQKALGVPPKQCYTDLHGEAIPALEAIHKFQADEIEKKGAHKAKQVLVIFDDVVGDPKFLKEPCVIKSFIASRHYNQTTVLNTQHFKRVPRAARMQASFLCFFALSNSEAEMVTEEYAPPKMTKRQFMRLIDDTLTEEFSFLTINMRVPWASRFRAGLGEIINLDWYRAL